VSACAHRARRCACGLGGTAVGAALRTGHNRIIVSLATANAFAAFFQVQIQSRGTLPHQPVLMCVTTPPPLRSCTRSVSTYPGSAGSASTCAGMRGRCGRLPPGHTAVCHLAAHTACGSLRASSPWARWRRLEAMGNQFFFMASFIWTSCLAIHICRRAPSRYFRPTHTSVTSRSLPSLPR
jgi:hypothetical protein